MKDRSPKCECGCGAVTTVDAKGNARRFRLGHNRRLVGSKGWIEQGRRFVSVCGRKKALARIVVEQELGRELCSDEVVHHVDGNSLNDIPANLIVLTKAEHMRYHRTHDRRCRWTEEEKDRLLQLRNAGMTLQEIARALGRPYSGTRYQAEKHRR